MRLANLPRPPGHKLIVNNEVFTNLSPIDLELKEAECRGFGYSYKVIKNTGIIIEVTIKIPSDY